MLLNGSTLNGAALNGGTGVVAQPPQPEPPDFYLDGSVFVRHESVSHVLRIAEAGVFASIAEPGAVLRIASESHAVTVSNKVH